MPKPDTTTVELRTDTVEKLIEHLKNPTEFNSHKPPLPYERRMAVAYRLDRQMGDGQSQCENKDLMP